MPLFFFFLLLFFVRGLLYIPKEVVAVGVVKEAEKQGKIQTAIGSGFVFQQALLSAQGQQDRERKKKSKKKKRGISRERAVSVVCQLPDQKQRALPAAPVIGTVTNTPRM